MATGRAPAGVAIATSIRPRRLRFRAVGQPCGRRSAAARAELRAVIEDVAGSTAHAYDVTDDRGQSMARAKIIASPGDRGFAGVYFTWREDLGLFEVHLATSSDLMTWTWQVMLASEASQPTIRAAQDGGYVVAWEETLLAGDPSTPTFAYYPTWEALLAAAPSKTYHVTLSLSPCCEGTPNLYSASSKGVDVGIHYFQDVIVDRQARATMDWSSWTVVRQPALDKELTDLGVAGSIGDRDAIEFEGYDFTIIEGQLRRDDWGAWRLFLHDEATSTAVPLDVRTHAGSLSMSNPTVAVVELDGRATVVVGIFIQEEAPGSGEEAQLLYYRTLDD